MPSLPEAIEPSPLPISGGRTSPIPDEERGWVCQILRRVGRRSPVSSIAQAVLGASPIQPAFVPALVDAVGGTTTRRWRERALAAWCLGRMPLREPELSGAAVSLCRVLDQTAPPHYMSHGGVGDATLDAMLSMLGLAVGIGLLGVGITFAPPTGLLGVLPAAIGVVAIASALRLQYACLTYQHVREAAVEALGRLKVPWAVGMVVRHASYSGRRVRAAARAALAETLPAVREESYGMLPAQAVLDMCIGLHLLDDGLVIAILGALGRAGDGRAMKPVQQLVKSGRTAAIRRAAADAIGPLVARSEREGHAAILLRPSEAPSGQATILLRPAGAGGEVGEELLLRPTEVPGREA